MKEINTSRPEYEVKEIKTLAETNTELLQMFKTTEMYLGRMLTISDHKIIFGLYDWLHMPFDLIECLIEFCAVNKQTSMQYIEKVAIAWINEGITTVEMATNKISMDKKYYEILDSLGIYRQNLTLIERDLINKWFNDYNFEIEIILKACERAVIYADKPSLKYVDSVLINWYKKEIVSVQDIDELDRRSREIKNTNFYKLKQENATLKLEVDELKFKLQRSIEKKEDIEEYYKSKIEILEMKHNAEAKLAIAELTLQIAELKEKQN